MCQSLGDKIIKPCQHVANYAEFIFMLHSNNMSFYQLLCKLNSVVTKMCHTTRLCERDKNVDLPRNLDFNLLGKQMNASFCYRNRKCPTSLITQQIISGTGIVKILEGVIVTLNDNVH